MKQAKDDAVILAKKNKKIENSSLKLAKKVLPKVECLLKINLEYLKRTIKSQKY